MNPQKFLQIFCKKTEATDTASRRYATEAAEHRKQALHLNRGIEFPQEPQVILEIVTEVVHLPLEHSDALQSHTEGKTAVLFRVDARSLEHIRVHHTAAQDFEPARTLADIATLAVTDIAAHIHLSRRLGEREIRRPHTDFGLRAEHLAGKQQNRLLQIRESHILVNIESLNLVENAVCTRTYGLIAEHSSRADHANRQRHSLHSTDLHAGGVGAQQQRIEMPGRHKESILHITGRVVGREIECLEHVMVILNLRTLRNIVSELAELLAEVNFKWWKNPKPVNDDNVKDELVDILHFFTAACIHSGMDAKELYERYMRKNKENFDRQYGKSQKHGYELDKM